MCIFQKCSVLTALYIGCYRGWLLTVADGSHRFVTARQKPPLLLVKPSVEGDQLCFDAPGMERLSVPIEPDVTALVRQQAKYAVLNLNLR